MINNIFQGPFQFQSTCSRVKGGWTTQEEVHLLDAIEHYGFGNWEDISKHIETRSPEDAKEKYINKFLNGVIGRHTWSHSIAKRPKLTDHTDEDNGPLSQTQIQKLPPLDATTDEAAQLGYLPNRNDFNSEYDPAAESLISSLTLNQDDEEIDVVLKLSQIDIYTRRLRERTRRKRLVRDYQLIINFFRNNLSRQTKEQREFRDRFRIFAQFYTAFEFDKQLAAFERERALKVRLSELYRYRWNGLTRLSESIHFEQHVAAFAKKNTGPHGLQGKTVCTMNFAYILI